MKTIGRRMRFYRTIGAKLKGGEMAAILNISQGSYSDLEHDHAKPSSDSLIRYCMETDINIYWLLTGEGKMARPIGEVEKEKEENSEISIIWQNGMVVGNHQVDNDHKYLISLINTIQAAVNCGLGKEVILNYIAQLLSYTEVHFKREEEIQRIIKFNSLDEHKESHERLLDQLISLRNEVGSAEPGEHQKAILEILFNDLKEWLFRHMLDEDLKMTEYFNLEKNHRVEDNSEE